MNRRYYSKAHFDRLSNGAPDTDQTISERIAYRNAAQQAIAERDEMFPQPWGDPLAVVEWQRARIAELMRSQT